MADVLTWEQVLYREMAVNNLAVESSITLSLDQDSYVQHATSPTQFLGSSQNSVFGQ